MSGTALKTVQDVMTREVITVSPSTSFREAVRLMEDERIDSLPVIEGGEVVGLVAESDLLLKEELSDRPQGVTGLPWQRRRDRVRAGATSVREAMSRHPATVRPTDTLSAAAHVMHRRHVGGLPVVDEGGRLLGIVTRSDLLKVFLRDDDELQADVVEALGGLVEHGVRCTVADGCVTLDGDVRLRSQAVNASEVALRVPGVVAVDCRIRSETDDVNIAMTGP